MSVADGNEFLASVADDDHIRVPFTASPEQLIAGISRLGQAWAAYGAQLRAVSGDPDAVLA